MQRGWRRPTSFFMPFGTCYGTGLFFGVCYNKRTSEVLVILERFNIEGRGAGHVLTVCIWWLRKWKEYLHP